MGQTNDKQIYFEQLCEKYYQPILKYIYVRTKNEATAKDLVQEVFLTAFERITVIQKHENPAGYLYLIAKNKMHEEFRQKEKEALQMISEEQIVSREQDLFEEIEKNMDQQIQEEEYQDEVLSCLSEQNRVLYKAYYQDKRSMKEIAKEFQMSEAGVRMRFLRIRTQIKKEVRRVLLNES